VFQSYKRFPMSRIVPTDMTLFSENSFYRVRFTMKLLLCRVEYPDMQDCFQMPMIWWKLLELYRRMGEYGGQQIIGGVMEDYTRVQFPETITAVDWVLITLLKIHSSSKDTYPTGVHHWEFRTFGYTGHLYGLPVSEYLMSSYVQGLSTEKWGII